VSPALDLDPLDLAVRLPDVDAVLDLITSGAYDEHLEDILAAAHGRKRAKRGLRHPYGTLRSA
jgi:hypothetical protein